MHRPRRTLPFLPSSRLLTGAAAGLLCSSPAVLPAQTAAPPPPSTTQLAALDPAAFSSSAAASTLPEAPLPNAPQSQNALPPGRQFGDPSLAKGSDPAKHIAAKDATFIPAGWQAQRLNVHEKVIAGATDLYSVGNIGATFISAGYSHLVNGQPNYGVDKGAFGQRLGAAAIRETSQSVFTEMVFGPLLHEDTRYYEDGPSHTPIHRTLYAITRPLITRTDNGGSTVNGALLLGYAASAALTPAFYPSINRNFHDTAATYGGSIGGAALGFFVTEVANDVFYKLHLRRTP